MGRIYQKTMATRTSTYSSLTPMDQPVRSYVADAGYSSPRQVRYADAGYSSPSRVRVADDRLAYGGNAMRSSYAPGGSNRIVERAPVGRSYVDVERAPVGRSYVEPVRSHYNAPVQRVAEPVRTVQRSGVHRGGLAQREVVQVKSSGKELRNLAPELKGAQKKKKCCGGCFHC